MPNSIEKAKNKVTASIDRVIGANAKEEFEQAQKLDISKLDIQIEYN